MKVLVVDDEEDVRHMVHMALRARGYGVEESVSGQDAIDRCASEDFDAIVVDYRMPRLTGLDVIRQLRSRGWHTPVILYSAFLDPAVEAEAEAEGVRAVGKENLGELLEAIEHAVSG